MTTSGTYNFGTSTEAQDVIVEAYERIGRQMGTLSENDLDSARRSMMMMFADWANKGPNLWEVELVALPLSNGVASYELDARTIYITQAATRTTSGTTNTDLVIYGISRAEYLAQPNKAQTAQRPTQFYLQRTNPPVLYLWPVPDNDNVTLLYYRMTMQQDVGKYTNTVDAPQRWLEAIAAGLAARLAVKFAPDRAAALDAQAARSYGTAVGEDRERVPMRISPDFTGGRYL